MSFYSKTTGVEKGYLPNVLQWFTVQLS
jgi:hypothetical protein